ncbi:signal-regulatory protein beta-1-like [Tachysurus fulvidraco]|uniref:signal-regulatory protein beta-1-like n=1 Tax=Tachysurus fulvidraco TaxID=1234273 RepID=UPI001FEDA1E4|nr:signal-regulatory protein beta-1-like [Tachysurus fulvidraco]
MSSFWILLFIFSTMYTVHAGRHWVTAQSVKKPPVYQPDKELSVNIGVSATLRCCYDSQNVIGQIDLFKQPKNKKPQIVVTVYKSNMETFHTGFQKSCFEIERSSNCFSIIILNTTQSDEAMYYCAVRRPNIVFGDGTYLQIKGDHVTIASETSKAALCDHSVVCEPTLHGNNTNTNTQHNTGEMSVFCTNLNIVW